LFPIPTSQNCQTPTASDIGGQSSCAA
jgi:hypothetical protein